MNKDTAPIHRLLCFAHRGEARAFLQELPLKFVAENFYDNEKLSLVISGEGCESTLINLTQAIVNQKQKHKEIEVINLGVCAALKDSPFKFEINDIIEVNTCYGEGEFKSFSTHHGKTSLISTRERILNKESAKTLSHFAPLVDREAWAVGRVCQELKVPFRVIKVVSDFADGDICARVKDETELWSDSLLREFLKLEDGHAPVNSYSLKEKLPELHITLSQERKLAQLFKALELKGYPLSSALEAINFTNLLEKDLRPKEKTKELTTLLQELLNPLEKTLKERLEANTEVLRGAGFQVSFDQGFEQEKVQLQISVESEAQINKMIAALESYDFMELRNILRGKEGDQDV